MTGGERPPPSGGRRNAGPLVRWRDPEKATARGWVAALGGGPLEVVGLVDHSAQGLPVGLVLKTRLGEYEVSGFWFKPVERLG